MKKQLGPLERLYPMPTALVVGGTMAEADTLAVAWINVVSSTPPTIAMGIRNSRRTLELIRSNGSFTVNLPDTALAAEADFCGITTGRKTDKFAATGLTLVPSAVVETPIIEQCPYNVECRVTEEVEVGEYVVVLGEIVECHAEEGVLGEDGKTVDVGLLDPLLYIAGMREYWSLGSKVAGAYEIGKGISAE